MSIALIHHRSPALFVLLAALAPLSAQATNGYISDGYGTKAEGVGGVSIALPQDSLVIAANPAGITAVGDRFDVGVDLFKPSREASITGNAAGADASYSGNSSGFFFNPTLGYVKQVNSDLALGIAVYGNGGMNTNYRTNPYSRFGASGSAGVNLEQLFVAPTIAYKIAEHHTLGLAVNVAYQRFSAKGLGLFSGFSSDPSHVTDHGSDNSYGAGVHIGYLGQLTDAVSLGLTYQSKTRMSKLDNYAGLFSNQGQFDIPETYGAGISVKATRALTLGFDYQRINYHKINAVGDGVESLFAGVPLGADNGPGFGWRNINVYKIGALYQIAPDWVARIGYSYSQQPIPSNQTFFNILAPAVIQDHATLGTTWNINKAYEVSFAYTYAWGPALHGNNSIPPAFGGGNANLNLKENIFSASFGYKL